MPMARRKEDCEEERREECRKEKRAALLSHWVREL